MTSSFLKYCSIFNNANSAFSFLLSWQHFAARTARNSNVKFWCTFRTRYRDNRNFFYRHFRRSLLLPELCTSLEQKTTPRNAKNFFQKFHPPLGCPKKSLKHYLSVHRSDRDYIHGSKWFESGGQWKEFWKWKWSSYCGSRGGPRGQPGGFLLRLLLKKRKKERKRERKGNGG